MRPERPRKPPEKPLPRCFREARKECARPSLPRPQGRPWDCVSPGHYTLRLGREKAKLALATSGERVTLTLSMKNPAEAELKLRIPSWTVEPMVQVNDEGGDAPETGKMFSAAPDVPGWGCDYAASSPKGALDGGVSPVSLRDAGGYFAGYARAGRKLAPGAVRRAGYGAGDGGCAAGNLPVENPRACACGTRPSLPGPKVKRRESYSSPLLKLPAVSQPFPRGSRHDGNSLGPHARESPIGPFGCSALSRAAMRPPRR